MSFSRQCSQIEISEESSRGKASKGKQKGRVEAELSLKRFSLRGKGRYFLFVFTKRNGMLKEEGRNTTSSNARVGSYFLSAKHQPFTLS